MFRILYNNVLSEHLQLHHLCSQQSVLHIQEEEVLQHQQLPEDYHLILLH